MLKGTALSSGPDSLIVFKCTTPKRSSVSGVFASLHPTLQGVLAHRLGWDNLRPVQEAAALAAAEGNDLLVIAGTAGGKTEAALIPVIDAVLKEGLPGVGCICLSPLKALINDQEERMLSICTPAGLSVQKWHGDVPKSERSWEGGDPPHILLTTPESLEVILLDPALAADLKNLRFVIVDEVHAFAGDLRGVQLRCLLDRLDRAAGRSLRRIGLSATLGNPQEILNWFSGPDRRARLVAVPSPPGKKQFSFLLADQSGQARAVARLVSGQRALVFVRSRSEAESLSSALAGMVGTLAVHHSSLSAAARKAAEESLAGQGAACVICTSTLELGIDIGGLDRVVQVGPPPSVSSFLQRLGRTGRRGSPARMSFVLADALALLVAVATVEAAMRREIEPLHPPVLPYTVFVQQLLLALLKERRALRRTVTASLLSCAAFAGIGEEDVGTLIDHLLAEGYLSADGGFLMLGPTAERTVARVHGRDLLSVFAGAGAFCALTPEGEEAGDLDPGFVAGGVGTVCTLGGRRWRIIALDSDHRIATVVPEGGGPRASDRRPFWSGAGAPMSPAVARAVQRVLARGSSSLPLGTREQAAIRGVAEEIGPGIPADGFLVRERDEGVLVLSCHGGRFNRALAVLLQKALGTGPKVRFSDLWLLVAGVTGPDPAGDVREALGAVQGWSRTEIADALPLPAPDTWKFGPLLPRSLFAGMVRADDDDCAALAALLAATPLYPPGEHISAPAPHMTDE
ncbi:MAG: ATP-dependent helicase Lhr and Lhr-like helicase [Methanofollis sp.]|nr:ATP-dependent helicase Lhr and Lhr-like helicase [Methanofollis sp.]